MRGRNFEKVEKVRDIIDIECLINVVRIIFRCYDFKEFLLMSSV